MKWRAFSTQPRRVGESVALVLQSGTLKRMKCHQCLQFLSWTDSDTVVCPRCKAKYSRDGDGYVFEGFSLQEDRVSNE